MTRAQKTRAQKIEAALQAAFEPKVLQVVDDSEAHRGHAGFQEGGESHFNVRLESDKFQGLSRIARHRAVHAAIGTELMSEIHALALQLSD